jgi:hypothetical protein
LVTIVYRMAQKYLNEILIDLREHGYRKKYDMAQKKLVKLMKEKLSSLRIIDNYFQ